MPVSAEWYDPARFPELRDGPPWVMDEMIAAEPELVERIATSADAAALALQLRSPGPHTVIGCGTSEHAALGTAAILADAGIAAGVREAFEALAEPQHGGSVIAVSHSGDTWATVEALRAARAARSITGLVTAAPGSAATRYADAVLATPLEDRSWCHTVGYTSPLAAACARAAAAGGVEPPAGLGSLVERALAGRAQVAAVAERLAGCRRLLVTGSGVDRVSARELTLKIEEACYIPTAMRDLETVLHGHLPAADGETGIVLIAAERRAAPVRRERSETMLAACRRIGMTTAALAREPFADELVSGGQAPVPDGDGLGDATAALLGAAPVLQLLALELALARGTNPDLIRREQAPYREAASIARDD